MNTGIAVWVVDDDDDCRYLMLRLLGLESGVKCSRGFCCAQEMLAALKHQPAPQVILMDLHMPGLSGIDAIPLVHELAPNTQVVIVTSCPDTTKRQQALARGAANFLSKDCSPGTVVEAVQCAALRKPMPGAAVPPES